MALALGEVEKIQEAKREVGGLVATGHAWYATDP